MAEATAVPSAARVKLPPSSSFDASAGASFFSGALPPSAGASFLPGSLNLMLIVFISSSRVARAGRLSQARAGLQLEAGAQDVARRHVDRGAVRGEEPDGDRLRGAGDVLADELRLPRAIDVRRGLADLHRPVEQCRPPPHEHARVRVGPLGDSRDLAGAREGRRNGAVGARGELNVNLVAAVGGRRDGERHVIDPFLVWLLWSGTVSPRRPYQVPSGLAAGRPRGLGA